MQRSAVSLLPQEVKSELDRRLIQSAFSDYAALAGWLESQGFEISKSSIHRYGTKFEEKLSAIKIATEQARAISEVAGDNENAMGNALTQMAQQTCFDLLMAGVEQKAVAPLVKAIADLNRSSVTVKKFKAEVLAKATEAADVVDEALKKEGVSDDTAAMIRAKFLGVAG